MEKSNHKPFNPLLGETYEYTTDTYKFLSEQVSHHPPITAVHIEGQDYRIRLNVQITVSFNGQYLCIYQKFRVYIFLDKFNEVLEIVPPVVSTHNLVPLMGSMYNDLGESMAITNLRKPDERCEV